MDNQSVVPPDLSLSQILQEAQNRWLRPPEVCEILNNYKRFKLQQEPPQKPRGGSVFLFDRKALRYFRKDGHNWRKKKDGKTVREAHERLKVGSKEVLHCYYAHGEDDESLQRRSYWMLDRDLEHIVFVHYREVKEGSRSNVMHTLNGHLTGSSLSNHEMGESPLSSSQTPPLISFRASSVPSSSVTSKQNSFNLPTQSAVCDCNDHTEPSVSPYSKLQGSNPHCSNAEVNPLSPPAEYVQTSVLQRDMELNSLSVMENGDKAVLEAFRHGMQHSESPRSSNFDILKWTESFRQIKNLETTGSIVVSGRPGLYPTVSSDNVKPYVLEPSLRLQQGLQDNAMPAAKNILHGSRVQMELKDQPSCVGRESSPQAILATTTKEQALYSSEAQRCNVKFENTEHGQTSAKTALGFERSLLMVKSTECEFNNQQEYLQRFNVGQQHLLQQHEGSFSKVEASRSNAFHSKEFPQTPVYYQIFKDFQADSLYQQEEQERLKRIDSFGRWITQEMAPSGDRSLFAAPSDSIYWSGSSNGADATSEIPQSMQLDVGLRLSSIKEYCFNIVDFSPDHAFSFEEVKVLVTGTFLNSRKDMTSCKWSCVFGDIEVPAELICPGVFRTKAPPHPPGKVLFYIADSNRVACSNVKEFEYCEYGKGQQMDSIPLEEPLKEFGYSKLRKDQAMDSSHVKYPESQHKQETLFQVRLAGLLSAISHADSSGVSPILATDRSKSEWAEFEGFCNDYSILYAKDTLVQKLLKEQLHHMLECNALQSARERLDEHGLGLLHMGAALGYDWMISLLVSSGLNIDFRDARGWTALHWAAYCGREKTVTALLAASANPGAKTDPSPGFPAGQTPADLAAMAKHKGIAGYLAESSLTSHLSSLKILDFNMDNLSGDCQAVQTLAERTSIRLEPSESEDQLSWQDSLAAVRNATQAAARIHATFRALSFDKRQEAVEVGEKDYGLSEEQIISIYAAKKHHKSGQNGPEWEPQSAAVHIQKKFRGWKGRKDFLIFRQRVVKIQAHVRGHQVRKHYRKIIWSVMILEKAILRWRRRGRGLRGWMRSRAMDSDNDEDFLKIGRDQTEKGVEKALARVQSMTRYPEARHQYRRLLDGFQKAKASFDSNGEVSIEEKVGNDCMSTTM